MNENVEFSISLPSAPVSVDDKVILNLDLANKDDQAVYVNARFAVVPQIGDVWLTVKRDDEEVPFRFRVRLAPLKNSDFLLLEPGERVVAGYQLSKAYRLEDPGAYTVSAVYVSQQVPPELAKERVFEGRVQAPVARLVVE